MPVGAVEESKVHLLDGHACSVVLVVGVHDVREKLSSIESRVGENLPRSVAEELVSRVGDDGGERGVDGELHGDVGLDADGKLLKVFGGDHVLLPEAVSAVDGVSGNADLGGELLRDPRGVGVLPTEKKWEARDGDERRQLMESE